MIMNKTYCDRCGKEIKETPKSVLRHRVYYGETLLSSIRERDDIWHDICVDCEDSFVTWFNHPEKDGEKDVH